MYDYDSITEMFPEGTIPEGTLPDTTAVNSAVTSTFLVILFAVLVMAIVYVISCWRINQKAEKPGWAAIVPFYNSYVLCQITFGDKSGWLCVIPCLYTICSFNFVNLGAFEIIISIACFIFNIILSFKLANVFDRSVAFGFGMLFLPFIFYPILAFGNSYYSGVYASGGTYFSSGNAHARQYANNTYTGTAAGSAVNTNNVKYDDYAFFGGENADPYNQGGQNSTYGSVNNSAEGAYQTQQNMAQYPNSQSQSYNSSANAAYGTENSSYGGYSEQSGTFTYSAPNPYGETNTSSYGSYTQHNFQSGSTYGSTGNSPQYGFVSQQNNQSEEDMSSSAGASSYRNSYSGYTSYGEQSGENMNNQF